MSEAEIYARYTKHLSECDQCADTKPLPGGLDEDYLCPAALILKLTWLKVDEATMRGAILSDLIDLLKNARALATLDDDDSWRTVTAYVAETLLKVSA